MVSNLTWAVLWIFTQPLKSTKFCIDGLFLFKVYEVWTKEIQKSYLSWHWAVIKLTLWFQRWHEELGDLSLEHSNSEKLYIDGLFLLKAYNVSARKFHRNCVMTLKGSSNLKDNWLVAWRMT